MVCFLHEIEFFEGGDCSLFISVSLMPYTVPGSLSVCSELHITNLFSVMLSAGYFYCPFYGWELSAQGHTIQWSELESEHRLAICRVHVLNHENGRVVCGVLYGSIARRQCRAFHWEDQEPEAHLIWRQIGVCMCPEAWKGSFTLMYTLFSVLFLLVMEVQTVNDNISHVHFH